METSYASVQDEQEALHDRTIRTRMPESFSSLFLLRQGVLRCMDTERETEGPALCFWPHSTRPSVMLQAGSQARILGLSDTILLDAIGARAESVHLRMLVERPFFAQLSTQSLLAQSESLFDWFRDELEDENRRSPMSLSAYLRLIFICALRVYQPEVREQGVEQTDILRTFRHLVELHYRDHWQMSRYAAELGVDYDRLHRICKREVGRSPAELVHERLTAEAKARLENSGYPLKRIAADLGFADPTRFSHFFKRRTDMSPGAYRAIVSRPDGEDLVELKRGFSDWP